MLPPLSIPLPLMFRVKNVRKLHLEMSRNIWGRGGQKIDRVQFDEPDAVHLMQASR